MPGTVLHRDRPRPGVTHYVTVLPNGKLEFDNGRQVDNPTAAARFAGGPVGDGWTAWHLSDGRSLADLRETLRLADREEDSPSDGLLPPLRGTSVPEPASLGEEQEQPPAEADAPSTVASTFWVPAGGSFDVDGRRIAGVVYVGQSETALSGDGPEPCLITPESPVDWESPDWAGDSIYQRPSYVGLAPGARAAYLGWLAHGRRATGVGTDYVLLFYYGLERRLLVDIDEDFDHIETEAVVAEIEALLGVYGHRPQFGDYARSLLALVEAVRSVRSPLQPVGLSPSRTATALPPIVRVGLGRCVADGSAVPAGWALSYLRHHPARPHRTPNEPCREEFDALFTARYLARFGDGLVIDPPARDLVLRYRPASPGIRQEIRRTVASVPDVEASAGTADSDSLMSSLRDLAWECIDDLEGYRRFVERWPALNEALLRRPCCPTSFSTLTRER